MGRVWGDSHVDRATRWYQTTYNVISFGPSQPSSSLAPQLPPRPEPGLLAQLAGIRQLAKRLFWAQPSPRLVSRRNLRYVRRVIYDASLDELLQRVWDGQRINQAEALRLYHLPLEELGALADRRRQIARVAAYEGRGNQIVTYIVDRNINYTNVCNVYCKFCAFYRTEKDDDSYVITLDELDKKIEETLALGGTQILMQGGHHPKLTKQWYLDLLAHMKGKFPQINIHGFSPSEFVHFREVFQEPLEKIIGDFKAAGLGSIPGGGGEILVDRVRQRVSPLKAMSDDWLEVMDVAHRLGLNSSATMMFGHVETVEDRVEHLQRVRAQQDKSKGFTAFIAWTFQAEHTKLQAPTVGAHEYLRTQALARIYLDNI